MIKDIFVFQLCKDKPAVQPSFCQPENTKSAPKRYGNTAAGLQSTMETQWKWEELQFTKLLL